MPITEDKTDRERIERYNATLKQLKEDAQTWKPHWHELKTWIDPTAGRYLEGDNTTETNNGEEEHFMIINGTADSALEVASSGLKGGLNSEATPWFTLSLADKDLMEVGSVREWLHNVRDRMLAVMAGSNFYDAVNTIYDELPLFGTACMFIGEDFDSVIRCRPFTIGEYYIVLDSKYRPAGLYREFEMTAAQILEKFDEDKISDKIIRAAKDKNRSQQRFLLVHVMQKRVGVKFDREDASGKEYESVYYEANNNEGKILKDEGFDTAPFMAPRWSARGTDTYGKGPGRKALGDVKMLQKMEEKKLQALDKMVDPPMNAPTALKGEGGTIIAGGVNYLDVIAGSQGFSPVYQVKPDMQNIAFEIDRVEKRIKNFFYNDLFLAIISEDKRMTAKEVASREAEKLQHLGPVVGRLQSEFNDPAIDRIYSIMDSFGLIPPAPQELENQQIKIEYTSKLAQAQKISGIGAIEETAEFVGRLANLKPDVIDKFDADEAVDRFADMIGISPTIIKGDDKVKPIREMREQEAQIAAQREHALQSAEGAKTLSETKMDDENALAGILEGGNL